MVERMRWGIQCGEEFKFLYGKLYDIDRYIPTIVNLRASKQLRAWKDTEHQGTKSVKPDV